MTNPKIQQCLRFRGSMKKFTIPNPTANQMTVEVIKSSTWGQGYLNRDFILLLHQDGKGVPAEYFMELQLKAIEDINFITEIEFVKNVILKLKVQIQ